MTRVFLDMIVVSRHPIFRILVALVVVRGRGGSCVGT